jgi:hypothetical protein
VNISSEGREFSSRGTRRLYYIKFTEKNVRNKDYACFEDVHR